MPFPSCVAHDGSLSSCGSVAYRVTYLFRRPACSRGFYPMLSFFFLSCWCWGAHKSSAPTACTLLTVLGHATFSFPVLATLVFVVFCECPIIFDLAKQRRENLWGVSEVGKSDFSIYFCWLYLFFLVFFPLLRSLATHQQPPHLNDPSST